MDLVFPIPEKYLIDHPFLTPENYTLLPNLSSQIKSLFIPINNYPYIIFDNYKEITEFVFDKKNTITLYFTNNYHMVISESSQFSNDKENYVATNLFRMYSMYHNKNKIHLSIKGSVLLFGTYRYQDNSYILNNFSVPYEIVEQVYRLYEAGIKTSQIKVR